MQDYLKKSFEGILKTLLDRGVKKLPTQLLLSEQLWSPFLSIPKPTVASLAEFTQTTWSFGRTLQTLNQN
jgi:hypothetical protein